MGFLSDKALKKASCMKKCYQLFNDIFLCCLLSIVAVLVYSCWLYDDLQVKKIQRNQHSSPNTYSLWSISCQRKLNHFCFFYTQVKKEELMKTTTLRYLRPLPCLCIEVRVPVHTAGFQHVGFAFVSVSQLWTRINLYHSPTNSSQGWSTVMDAPRVRVCPFKDRESFYCI